MAPPISVLESTFLHAQGIGPTTERRLWEAGAKDKLVDPLWADEILLRQRRAYKALGAEEGVSVDRFDGGHVWHGKEASVLLAKTLKAR